MKRVIISILGALCFSIIMMLIFPNSFLEGEAQWTYQSDVGRLDISFEGNIQNGQVDAKGEGIRVDKPKWFLRENYQGTLVHFPVSYFKKSYQILIIPQGNKTGEKFSLILNFLGKDFRIDNQVKPAYVRFKNIKINNKLITDEQTVWLKKSFRYPLQNLSDFNPIQIEFEIQKPIILKGIIWKNLIAFIGLFILLFWFPFSQKIGKVIFSKTVKIFSLIINIDIVKVISDSYFRIDRVYRRSFGVIFCILCMAFGFHTVQYMWGNHDWGFLVYPRAWHNGVWMGRYTLNLFKIWFLNGVYVPVIYDIITFLVLSLNAVLICIYWRLPKQIVYIVLCGLVLTAQPFTLAMLYYVHMLPETFMGVTFVLAALLLSEKIAFEKSSFVKKGFLALICIVLINLSLAMYPVIINTIAVAFVGRLLIQSLDWNGSWKNFKSCFFPFVISVINIILGVVSYKAMITYVYPVSIGYNTDILPLEKLPERLLVLLKQSFYQLYDYSFPFISQPILWVFLSLTVLMALYICFKGNIKQKIVRLLLLFGALFATQTAMIIANTHVINGRIELFGLVVFETLIAVLIFTNLKKLHSFFVITMAWIAFAFVVDDLDCLRVWKLGFDAEKMLWNRILSRLEAQEDFNINHKYKIVQIGEFISLRRRYYTEPFKNKGADNLLMYSYDARWDRFHAHEFYYPFDFRDKTLKADISDPEYKAELKRLYEAGILDKAEAWPHQNGLIVWKDIILFVIDDTILENYKKQLEKEFPKPKGNSEENLSETDDPLLTENN